MTVIVKGNEMTMNTFGAENAIQRIGNLTGNGFMDSLSYKSIFHKVRDMEQLERWVDFGIMIKDSDQKHEL